MGQLACPKHTVYQVVCRGSVSCDDNSVVVIDRCSCSEYKVLGDDDLEKEANMF
jgi:hypothetical protein